MPSELEPFTKAWSGDLDGILERRVVRILTVYQLGSYFLDGPVQKGMTYDLAKMFETFLNEHQGSGHVKIHVVLIPVEFDQLFDGLVQGYGDIAIAGISSMEARGLAAIDIRETNAFLEDVEQTFSLGVSRK